MYFNIAIDKKYRGSGYGRILVDSVLEILEEKNFSVTLEVRKDNIVAINLYESLGFKEAGVRKDYYGIGKRQLIRKAHEAGAVYKIGKMVLFNRRILDDFFRRTQREE